ncbi:YafY family protein [Sphingomonas sp. BK235]|uniref:helix-turn-helix transcriptional regulator n=1 Tax=Sphingomonas sp. BK235 TaxID=2512131 RepID=UPI00104CE512|nr:YafY family protein [Sphingomonas sp. BK235]TCP31880.1 HTH domain-containing protein [Sphingomonas sp. BK235]
MSRTSRLFELIGVLRARRTPVTATDLSEALGVSPRSIYRDIETLRGLGAPIAGQAGIGYQLGAGFFLPPLAFSPDELDVLILGLGWVRERADATLVASGESALAKILSARGGDALGEASSPALLAAASLSRRADPPQVATLRDAIRRQRKLAIHYADAAGTPSERIVWPIAIVYFDDARVLAAWCERRDAFRHFRVDRIAAATLLDQRYPGRRHALYTRWRAQDRDWRALLTVSDRTAG